MNPGITDLTTILRTLEPVLHPGVYVYSAVQTGTDIAQIPAIATFHETEGVTVITTEEAAIAAGLPILFRAAWITLRVNSALSAVGLTAAFSRALSEAGISCTVVAAAHHDHLFVPVERAAEAMVALRELQRNAIIRRPRVETHG